jgi:hypothetical protein
MFWLPADQAAKPVAGRSPRYDWVREFVPE